MTHPWNKRPRSTGKASRPDRQEPHDIEPRDALSWPSANTWEHDFHLRQHHPTPLAQANLTYTDATGLSESGLRETVSSKKLRDAATTRKFESLAATRQWFALYGSRAARVTAMTLAEDERGERDRQLA